MECMTLRGVRIYKGHLSRPDQLRLLDEVRDVARKAPLFRPVTSRGQPMSVRMTSAGELGWISDRQGYRYQDHHPDGMVWPPIPPTALSVWGKVSGVKRKPECCLVNYYEEAARMGLHQDKDETDVSMPVVSISLGDDALFRIGNQTRGGKTESVWLQSGDVVVMGGAARLLYHGVDRLRFGSSALLEQGGRINLTLRVVT